MLGVSHAVQNEKKLWKFTQSDSVDLLYLLRCLVYHMLFKTRRNSGSLHGVIRRVYLVSTSSMLGVSHAVQNKKLWKFTPSDR